MLESDLSQRRYYIDVVILVFMFERFVFVIVFMVFDIEFWVVLAILKGCYCSCFHVQVVFIVLMLYEVPFDSLTGIV